jgi:hypothetical protein
MATSKKSVPKKPKARGKAGKAFTISIDLSALEKLYKNRYVVTLDGGGTKGGSVKIRDGDTKGGLTIMPPVRKAAKKLPGASAKKRVPKKT